jgi:hypothetical protein
MILKKLKINKTIRTNILITSSYNKTFYDKFFNSIHTNLVGGDDIEIRREKIKFREYEFTLKIYLDQDGTKNILKISSKDFGECLLIFIDKDIEYAYINNISNFPDCANNKVMPYIGGGKIILNIAINYIRENKKIFSKSRIILQDNSRINCVDKNNKIINLYLAPLTTLKNGVTWYGMFGFKSFSSLTQKPDKQGMQFYKDNIKTMSKIKLYDNFFIIQLIMKVEEKYKYNIISQNVIDKIINSDKNLLVKDFIKKILKIDKFCVIFEKIYLRILLRLQLYNFTGTLFYLDI